MIPAKFSNKSEVWIIPIDDVSNLDSTFSSEVSLFLFGGNSLKPRISNLDLAPPIDVADKSFWFKKKHLEKKMKKIRIIFLGVAYIST